MTEQNTLSTPTPSSPTNKWIFLRKVVVRALIFFVLFNLIFILIANQTNGITLSAYNFLFPGRERLPFGENSRESYNLSLYDIDAMVASHKIAGVPQKASDEYRVIVIGDSSIWGTLLHNQDTFTGQLNQQNLTTADGKSILFYNLGYPSMSVTKDLLILERVKEYDPDLILWGITLESMVMETQLSVPMVSNNLLELSAFQIEFYYDAIRPTLPNFFEKNLIAERRAIADWIRLQVYGVMWAATEIDQSYPEHYPEAMRDFAENSAYRSYQENTFSADDLAFQVLSKGQEIAGDIPIVFFNEPILISKGENSDLRYNFMYSRWAYDAYRNFVSNYFNKTEMPYFDLWDSVPQEEFTNSAVHMTPAGETIFIQSFIKNIFPAIIQ